MNREVSVVVPCRNERDSIGPFLDSVLAQQGTFEALEVLVADGASDDGTREILCARMATEPRLRLVDNPRRTVSPGLNAAIRAARGSVIVRMDVHSVYAPDYVEQCLEALATSGAQNVGGPAVTRATTRFQQANAVAYRSPYSVGGARFHDPGFEGYVDTVTYGCWRKETLLELGLFDEDFVRNQDDELNLRLVRRGGRIWQTPRIRSWYYPRASLGALVRQYYQYGYWKVRVIAKHRMPASWRHLVPVSALVLAALLVIAGILDRRAWLVLMGLAGAYLAVTLVASVVEAARARSWASLPLLPVIFAAYHWSYAIGFAHGLLHRLLGRSRPHEGAVGLSR